MAVKQKGSGTKKHGRNEKKCKQYALLKIREKHKLKRIARSNGWKAAQEYAAKYGLQDFVKRYKPKETK